MTAITQDVSQDGPQLIELDAFDLERGREELSRQGFTICRGLVNPASFLDVQSFWIDFYRNIGPSDLRPVCWSPFLGEKNFTGFSDNDFNKLFRTYDFLWERPYHHASRQLCLELNTLRNRLAGKPDFHGVLMAEDGHGIYNTTSCYPDDGGWMRVHEDGMATGYELIHFIMPITFCGVHYAKGGMRVVDRGGVTHEVDGMVKPGDVIFYDGALPHGVERLEPMTEGGGIGRIQLFAIPTRFTSLRENEELYRHLDTKMFVRAKVAKAVDVVCKLVFSRSAFRS